MDQQQKMGAALTKPHEKCQEEGSIRRYALVDPRGFSAFAVVEGEHTPAPPDFYKIPVDLNEGADGAYLYLCTLRSNPGLIRRIEVIPGGDPVPPGYTLVDADLNLGTDVQPLYLCYTLTANLPVITGIGVMSAGYPDPDPGEGWERYPTDLNKDADGRYIYFIYTRSGVGSGKSGHPRPGKSGHMKKGAGHGQKKQKQT